MRTTKLRKLDIICSHKAESRLLLGGRVGHSILRSYTNTFHLHYTITILFYLNTAFLPEFQQFTLAKIAYLLFSGCKFGIFSMKMPELRTKFISYNKSAYDLRQHNTR